MAKHPAPRVQAAIAVIERRGRYLISRRRPSGHLGGFWEFPGGKRRVGETWEACLHRELSEELGITAKVHGRLEPLRLRYDDRQVHLAVFRCAIARGIPKPLGCQEIRWMTPAQLSRCRFPAANRPLVALLTKLRQRPSHVILQTKRRTRP